MTPEEILERANRPEVPKFIFGSEELKVWTRKHVNQTTGECMEDSGLYVVIHRSLHPSQRPDFRVLSNWVKYRRTPFSWDVPLTESIPGLVQAESQSEQKASRTSMRP